MFKNICVSCNKEIPERSNIHMQWCPKIKLTALKFANAFEQAKALAMIRSFWILSFKQVSQLVQMVDFCG